MNSYFWKQQDDIPAGMGYPLFMVNPGYLIGYGFMTACVILMVYLLIGMRRILKR